MATPAASAKSAFAFLRRLKIAEQTTWGAAAERFQLVAAEAVLSGVVPYFFWTRPRGGSKTFDAAALLVTIMLIQAPPGARLYVFAADRDQGALVIHAIRELVSHNPHLQPLLHITTFQVRVVETGVVLDVMAADGPSVYGLRPYFAVVDELAQWRDSAQSRAFYEAIHTAMPKWPGRLLVCTTPGDPNHFAREVRNHAAADPLWRLDEVPGPVPWTESRLVDEQRRALPPSQFRRFVLGEWAEAEDRLAVREDLEQCVRMGGELSPSPRCNYVIGVDLGVMYDTTAVAVCHRERQGPPGGDVVDSIVVDKLVTWQPSPAREVILQEVEHTLEELARSYNGARIVVDPWQAEMMRQSLRRKGFLVDKMRMSESQVSQMAILMFTLIRDHRLEIENDPALIDELARIKLKEKTPGTYRLDHVAGRHDDRAIAIAISAVTLVERPLRGPRILDLSAPRGPIQQEVATWRPRLSKTGKGAVASHAAVPKAGSQDDLSDMRRGAAQVEAAAEQGTRAPYHGSPIGHYKPPDDFIAPTNRPPH